VFALQPPTEQQLERYKKENTLNERIEKARSFNNHLTTPQLQNRATEYLKQKGFHPSVKPNQENGLEWNRGLPSKGTVKTFTLLIDFDDFPAPGHQGAEILYDHIYGDGNADFFPNESLTQFYLRSSYNQLNITGDVIGWYRLSKPRSEYSEEEGDAASDIIREALSHFESEGHDFSQYDNDNDGYIDYFSVVWTGDVGEWATLWWGWKSTFHDPNFLISDKKLASFSWQWLSFNNTEDEFSPSVLIHETGHGLGLPDYYDYDDDIGPKGGVGGLDRMDSYGDHGAFSKFMLDWIEPQVLATGSKTYSFQPSSTSQDALIIMPELTLDNKYSEYFVVQHRDENENDSNYPNSGMLIWHVDAKVSEYGFINSNSYSKNKLIKLVQADGLSDVELGVAWADEGDYYSLGQSFTTTSNPDSASYENGPTGIEIKDISTDEDILRFSAEIVELPQINITGITDLEIINSDRDFTVEINSGIDITHVNLNLGDNTLATDNTPPYTFTLAKSDLTAGQVTIKVEAYNANGARNFKELNVLNINSSDYIIAKIGEETKLDLVKAAFSNLSKTAHILPSIPSLNGQDIAGLFIFNSYINNYQEPLSLDQQTILTDYISSGGELYYENDIWFWSDFDHMESFTNAIGIAPDENFSTTSNQIKGSENTLLSGYAYTVPEENYFYSHTGVGKSTEQSSATSLWELAEDNFSVGMYNAIGDSHIIATTERFTNIPATDRQKVLTTYLSILSGDTTSKVGFHDSRMVANEGDSFVSIQLFRTLDGDAEDSINIIYEDGTAKEGEDYSASIANVSFSPGELITYFEVPLLKDDEVEIGALSFNIKLQGENVSEANTLTVTINDSDYAGRVYFDADSFTVTESDSTASFTIKRDQGFNAPLSFTLKATDGEAINGQDYIFTQVSAELNANSDSNGTEALFVIEFMEDHDSLRDKSFMLEIESDFLADNYQALPVTILNTDPQEVVGFSQNSVSVSESSGNLSVTLTRTGGIDDEITVSLSSSGDTASLGTDFTLLADNIVFLPQESQKVIDIGIVNNSVHSEDKVFTLSISGENVLASANSVEVTIINDDKKQSSGSLGYLSISLCFLLLLYRRKYFN
jgi:M6 family metalloprotease-like protein